MHTYVNELDYHRWWFVVYSIYFKVKIILFPFCRKFIVYNGTVRDHSAVVQHNMILQKALQWLIYHMNQGFELTKDTPYLTHTCQL